MKFSDMPNWLHLGVRPLIAAGIGLTPYLGTVDHFTTEPLQDLLQLLPTLPHDSRGLVLAIVPVLMAVVSAGGRVYKQLKPNPVAQARCFKTGVRIGALALLAFLIVRGFAVEEKQLFNGRETVTVAVGLTRPDTCKECDSAMSDLECLSHTTLEPELIQSCWVEWQIAAAEVGLVGAYVVLAAAIGFIIGVWGDGSGDKRLDGLDVQGTEE